VKAGMIRAGTNDPPSTRIVAQTDIYALRYGTAVRIMET
jgi:hypothetical protein